MLPAICLSFFSHKLPNSVTHTAFQHSMSNELQNPAFVGRLLDTPNMPFEVLNGTPGELQQCLLPCLWHCCVVSVAPSTWQLHLPALLTRMVLQAHSWARSAFISLQNNYLNTQTVSPPSFFLQATSISSTPRTRGSWLRSSRPPRAWLRPQASSTSAPRVRYLILLQALGVQAFSLPSDRPRSYIPVCFQ